MASVSALVMSGEVDARTFLSTQLSRNRETGKNSFRPAGLVMSKPHWLSITMFVTGALAELGRSARKLDVSIPVARSNTIIMPSCSSIAPSLATSIGLKRRRVARIALAPSCRPDTFWPPTTDGAKLPDTGVMFRLPAVAYPGNDASFATVGYGTRATPGSGGSPL